MGLLDLFMFAILPMTIGEGEGGTAEPSGDQPDKTTTDGKGDQPDKTTTDAPEKKPVPVEQQMLDGIKTALKPESPEEKTKRETEAAAAAALAEANKGKTPEVIEQERVALEAEKTEKARKAEEEKQKGKRADDYQLSPEEKKALSQGAQQRFHELHAYGKRQEAEVTRLSGENTALLAARDNMMAVFEQAHVEPEDLSILLEYNKKVKTGDLAGALGILNEARVGLLKALGKEEPGVDLLEEFPDLAKKVTDLEMDRAGALEIANSRRRAKQDEQNRIAQDERERQDQNGTRAREDALAGIDKWCKESAKGDIDYKAKEAKIMAKRGDKPSMLDEILQTYPPNLWLKTLQHLFSTIEIVKAPAPKLENEPLRPSGAKEGAKVFNELTPDALRAGLAAAGHPQRPH